MNTRALVFVVFVFCVVTVCAVDNKSETVRDKRTLHIVLQAFADSLGYDIQKRPPAPPNAIAKPGGGRSPVNPPLVPPMMPPPKGPTIPMMPAPKAPPMAPPMPPPKAPMPAPKAPPAPMMPPMAAKPPPATPTKPTGPRLPTVPPLLTETIQKMFNINFNWNRNMQTPPPNAPKSPAPPMTQAPAPAPKAPAPAPKTPPAPSQAPAPAPKAPAPKAPAPAPSVPAPAPKAPATTTGPVKHVLYSYDYDDGQLAYPQNLKEYDNYYQYDNADYQQPQQQEQQQQQPEEEVKQPSEEAEAQSKEAEDTREQQQQSYGDVVQNYWQTSPWNHNQQENQQEESRIPQFVNKDFGGHNFVVNHPGGNSYSRMEIKKTIPSKQQQNFEAPIYYYEEQQQPPLETRNHQLEQQNYHFQGPSFDQYFYAGNGVQNGEKTNVEVNSNEEIGQKQSAESRQQETVPLEATLPLPAHNIYQEKPYLQWISPFEASSEVQEKKVKATNAKQKQNGKPNPTDSPYGPYAFNYEPDHYNADFSLHTIPPPSQEDYSKYEPAPFKVEDELSNKAQIKEQQYGRKYTTIHADNLVHRTVG